MKWYFCHKETPIHMYNKIYYGKPDFTIGQVPYREEPTNVLMCSPEYFEIIDVKNAFMKGFEGATDANLAMQQWLHLKEVYEDLKTREVISGVQVIPGAPGLEDMVFCANQTFPWITPDGKKVVMMSEMKHASRKKEVPFFEMFFKEQGYSPLHFTKTDLFEGMGDTIPHPFKKLLYGGYGHRSKPDAHAELSEMLQVPVIALELPHEKFYHLDTCFLPLNTDHVMLCRDAFTPDGLDAIHSLFQYVHFIPETEAETTFCLNAHIPYHKNAHHAIVQKGSKEAWRILNSLGFIIHELDTSEFMKSGGSVFCMKMMMY